MEQKLIVTLPWVVQFLGMLDAVTLRSDYYQNVFQLLYELYIMSAEQNFDFYPSLILRPESLFIIRSCLGWLFDQRSVPNDYYGYRQNRKPIEISNAQINSDDFLPIEILVPKALTHFFDKKEPIILRRINDTNTSTEQTVSCLLEKCSTITTTPTVLSTTSMMRKSTDNIDNTFEPLLESILISACPFLADFRVTITPKRNSKEISRTGRYRHITTKVFDSPSINSPTILNDNNKRNKNDDAQTKLVEAFLHSQTLSVRRTVEFVQERVYSAIVKDFQVEILIPFKKCVTNEVDKIQLTQRQEILEKLYQIYVTAHRDLLGKWKVFINDAALKRVKV